jgi:hypothetical protein
MKSKNFKKKLLLNKQTVVNLSGRTMKHVLGGETGRTACIPTCDTFRDTGCCIGMATEEPTCPPSCQLPCESQEPGCIPPESMMETCHPCGVVV